MTRPWEDTVVLALRDIQWMDQFRERPSAPPLPELFIKLDGNTEKTLGDLIFESGEKFYLFEVKPGRTKISSEWNKTDREGNRKQKTAYQVLSAAVEAWNKDAATWKSLIETSLRCHHFVYWSNKVFDTDDTFGNILVEPYICACMAIGGQPDEMKGVLMPVCDPPFEVGIPDWTGNTYNVSQMLPFSMLRAGKAHVVQAVGTARNQHLALVEGFGVDLDLFKHYLQFICDNAGEGGEIHAVICSDRNRFAKVITSIKDLERQLSPTRPSEHQVTPAHETASSRRTLPTRSVPAPPQIMPQRSLAAAVSNVLNQSQPAQPFPVMPRSGLAARLRP
jgi:hypothetical protein